MVLNIHAVSIYLSIYLSVLCWEYTTGIIEPGCGRETDKAQGVECLIRSRDHIRVQ